MAETVPAGFFLLRAQQAEDRGEMPGTASATQMQAVPLAPGGGVRSLPDAFLELSRLGSPAGWFLTDPGTETCSRSGSLSTNNGAYMYVHHGNDK